MKPCAVLFLRISRVTPWIVVKNKTAHGFMDAFRAEVYLTKLVLVVMRVCRASDFPLQKKQFSVSKKVKFRFDSVSLLATLNSMKSQYIERKCGERTVKMAQLVR